MRSSSKGPLLVTFVNHLTVLRSKSFKLLQQNCLVLVVNMTRLRKLQFNLSSIQFSPQVKIYIKHEIISKSIVRGEKLLLINGLN